MLVLIRYKGQKKDFESYFIYKVRSAIIGEVWGTMIAEKRDNFPQEIVS